MAGVMAYERTFKTVLKDDKDRCIVATNNYDDMAEEFYLFSVCCVVKEPHKESVLVPSVVLAASENGACRQAEYGRENVVSTSAVRIPFRIRGFGEDTF